MGFGLGFDGTVVVGVDGVDGGVVGVVVGTEVGDEGAVEVDGGADPDVEVGAVDGAVVADAGALPPLSWFDPAALVAGCDGECEDVCDDEWEACAGAAYSMRGPAGAGDLGANATSTPLNAPPMVMPRRMLSTEPPTSTPPKTQRLSCRATVAIRSVKRVKPVGRA